MNITGRKLYKVSKTTIIICILVLAYAILDGNFFRGFGDDEFIEALIFYSIFLPSLLYTIGYCIYTKLPDTGETETDPPWFRRMCFGATTYPLIIAGISALCAVIGFSGQYDPLEGLLGGFFVTLAVMLIVPVIPVANMILIIHFYRKNRRKKNK